LSKSCFEQYRIHNERSFSVYKEKYYYAQEAEDLYEVSLISMSIGAVLLILTVPHPWAVGGIVLIMLAVQLWLWFKA
jgi:hypothetical protein